MGALPHGSCCRLHVVTPGYSAVDADGGASIKSQSQAVSKSKSNITTTPAVPKLAVSELGAVSSPSRPASGSPRHGWDRHQRDVGKRAVGSVTTGSDKRPASVILVV